MRNIGKLLLMLLLVINAFSAFGQDVTKHSVVKGETITQIAQRYQVTPFDIYRLNPDAQNGLKEKMVLLIPAAAKAGSASRPATHTAKSKETLFSIAREYSVTVDDLMRANPILSEGLKVGQVIKIPAKTTTTTVQVASTSSSSSSSSAQSPGKTITHIVESKETKFGIAKKYGLSVEELERQNPDIKPGLKVGDKLSISASGTVQIAEKPAPVAVNIPVSASGSQETIKTVKREGYANYEVKPQETLFSLSQTFGISQQDLIKLNPSLKDGVRTGMILKVPGRGSIIAHSEAGFVDLSKSLSTKERKKLVLLLPFNADKIQGDTIKSIAERLKKEPFLNMTLDFYAGALMAVDSAKALGLNLDVRIYDSEESKSSSSVERIVQTYKLHEADAVIGPFYQQYSEKVAEMLLPSGVPVISPLSKEAAKPYANLYQAMPSAEYSKAAIFEYMQNKNANIVMISDPKKAANREFVTQNFPAARFVELNDNGSLNADKLRALLIPGKMNYVVLDSERTGMILGATNLLLNEMANHQLQLVIMEQNETLDFEEISMKRLTILKMLYPSLTREGGIQEASVFENEFRKRNKMFPSPYAVRGFDVTFDTMLRLSQEKGFAASAAEDKTQHVESKFIYTRNSTEGFVNKGVFILQYNEDLSVTEAQ